MHKKGHDMTAKINQIGTDRYDLYDNGELILEGATRQELDHFLTYGHAQCEGTCEVCR